MLRAIVMVENWCSSRTMDGTMPEIPLHPHAQSSSRVWLAYENLWRLHFAVAIEHGKCTRERVDRNYLTMAPMAKHTVASLSARHT